jgi:hypothetical protein
MAYLLGRTNVANQSDLRPTQQQLFSYEFGPLSSSPSSKSASSSEELNLTKKNPVDEIFAMSPRQFYELFTRLLVENPPSSPQDDEIVQKMGEAFGIFPGLFLLNPDRSLSFFDSFLSLCLSLSVSLSVSLSHSLSLSRAGQEWSYSSLSPKQQSQLSHGMTQGISLMYSYPTDTINGWTVPNMATGNFSSDYYLRAYIALVLYAANVPQDAVYYNSDLFPSGEDLTYLIEFSPTTSGPATSGPGQPVDLRPLCRRWFMDRDDDPKRAIWFIAQLLL